MNTVSYIWRKIGVLNTEHDMIYYMMDIDVIYAEHNIVSLLLFCHLCFYYHVIVFVCAVNSSSNLFIKQLKIIFLWQSNKNPQNNLYL